MQSKQTRCTSIMARLHGDAHAAVGYRNFANGSERKGLSAFTGKFPFFVGCRSTFNFENKFLRKKSRLVRYHMVECFHAITIDAKRFALYM